MTRRRLRRLARDDHGATIVEFGILLVPLTVTLLTLFDFGYRAYLGAIVEGVLQEAARKATIGDQTTDGIDAFVRGRLTSFQHDANVTIVKKSYSQFSGVGKDEKYTDSNENAKYDKGVDCFYDDNGNGKWDGATAAGRAGLGGSDDLVLYTVRVQFDRIVPLEDFLGWSARETVESNMVLRNQPYGSQAFPECRK